MKNKSNQPSHYRQGDVLIERIDALPTKRTKLKREQGRVVLAHGEVTGHHHSLADKHVDLYETGEPTDVGVTFLEVKEAMAALTHQEHATIEIPPGSYRVTRQREYSPEAIRNVQD
jgi:hypothetical protein